MLAKIWRFLHLPTKLQLWIMRLFHDEFLIGVTGVFLDDKNRVFLVRHTYRGDWSLPGGYIKSKEHPKEALEREVKEETGLEVLVEERMKIRTDRETARLDITYSGSYIGGVFTPSNEVKEVALFPFDMLPAIPKDQLLFVNQALEQRRSFRSQLVTEA